MEQTIEWSIDRTGDPSILQGFLRELIIPLQENLLDRLEENINIIQETFIIEEEEKTCFICYEERNNFEICRFCCQHKFCYICVKKVIKTNNITCPLCRTIIGHIYVQNDDIFNFINK